MSELDVPTFANFEPHTSLRYDIVQIGSKEDIGVLEEMSVAFGCELRLFPWPHIDDLRKMIETVGPAKTLQDNIEHIQAKLHTKYEAVDIARDWVIRSGLLEPVDRYFGINRLPDATPDVAIITGGVRNWMQRRAGALASQASVRRAPHVILAGGSRLMGQKEGPDVDVGMREADYLKEIILPQLNENGFDSIEFCRVESDEGEHVMQHAALRAASKVDLRKGLVQIVGNAGNWVQNAGQFRMAVRYHLGRYGFDDEDNPQLCVVTDAFPLGTGVEPASTHQNPHSALGQIVRNYYILAKNTPAFR